MPLKISGSVLFTRLRRRRVSEYVSRSRQVVATVVHEYFGQRLPHRLGSTATRWPATPTAFFARSDRKFTSKEVTLSGAVASDRSANERAVNRLKLAKTISKGIHPKEDLEDFSEHWITWGFTCNFMWDPVL